MVNAHFLGFIASHERKWLTTLKHQLHVQVSMLWVKGLNPDLKGKFHTVIDIIKRCESRNSWIECFQGFHGTLSISSTLDSSGHSHMLFGVVRMVDYLLHVDIFGNHWYWLSIILKQLRVLHVWNLNSLFIRSLLPWFEVFLHDFVDLLV